MDAPIRVFGYDPGGNSGHGVAVLELGHDGLLLVDTATAASAEEAFCWFEQQGKPHAIGIDTLTALSGGKSGWRSADTYLRLVYPAHRNSVCSPNFLSGSMCLSGLYVLERARKAWPDLPATEAHPKLLWADLCPERSYPQETVSGSWLQQWATFCGQADANLSPSAAAIDSEHAFDGCLAAFAALQMVRGVWSFDLHGAVHRDPKLWHPAGTTQFVWPGLPKPAGAHLFQAP